MPCRAGPVVERAQTVQTAALVFVGLRSLMSGSDVADLLVPPPGGDTNRTSGIRLLAEASGRFRLQPCGTGDRLALISREVSAMNMRIRKTAVSLAAAALLGVTSVAVTATPAGATNSNCSTHTNYAYAVANCYSGGGQFKVAMRCKDWWGWWSYAEGPWRTYSWETSTAFCPPGLFAVDSWVLRR